MTADYNSSSNSILDQNQLQSNGINTPPNLYMSTGVGGGKKRKSQKGNKNGIKKGGDCGCSHNNNNQLPLPFLTKGGKKQRKSKKSKKGGKKQRKTMKKCPW